MFNYLLALTFFAVVCGGTQWPIPYKVTNRPEVNPECKPLSRDFCKDGLPYGNFPIWWADDTISLYALTQTKEELKDTVMKQTLTSYTLGLRSSNTGKNYTLSWEPVSKLNDTIAPRILPGGRVVWCNQAAACLREDKQAFKAYKSMRIGTINGEQVNAFEVWVKHVNNTMPFQQEFLVHNGTQVFVSSFDSTVIFMRAIKTLKSVGATFSRLSLKMDVYVVVSEVPSRLGTETDLRKNDSDLWKDIVKFYGYLQATDSSVERFWWKVRLYFEMHEEHKFYYFFNGEYWHLKVKSPYKEVTELDFQLP